MAGPEEIPYGSLGSYANAVSTQYNLSNRQIVHFLINEIPAKSLPGVSREAYSQTATLGDTPESPQYHEALGNILWAANIDIKRRKYADALGIVGATVGGGAGLAVQSVLTYNSYIDGLAGTVAPAEIDDSFSTVTTELSLTTAPVLAAGIIGAYAAKKCSPRVMKAVARRAVNRIKASGVQPDVDDLPAAIPVSPGEINRDVVWHITSDFGNHLETVDDGQLYQIAKRWANQRGCYDEQKYADFLVAEMPATEVTSLVVQTKVRLATAVTDRSELLRQDPRYASLLQDMQVANAITNGRIETNNTLKKAYRFIGYLGVMSFFGFQVSGTAEAVDLSEPPLSYEEMLSILAMLTISMGTTGRFLSDMFANKTNYLTRLWSKRQAADASECGNAEEA